MGVTPRCTVSGSSPLSWRGFSSGLLFTTGPTGSNGVSELRRMGIEAFGDALPSPWGDRIEIVLRELGGFIWIQITALIIFIRVVFSTVATGWRYRRRDDA